jgi:hypothetical protein
LGIEKKLAVSNFIYLKKLLDLIKQKTLSLCFSFIFHFVVHIQVLWSSSWILSIFSLLGQVQVVVIWLDQVGVSPLGQVLDWVILLGQVVVILLDQVPVVIGWSLLGQVLDQVVLLGQVVVVLLDQVLVVVGLLIPV